METSTVGPDLDAAVSHALSLAVSHGPAATTFEALTASGLPPPLLLSFIEESIGQASRDGEDPEAAASSLLHLLQKHLQKSLSEATPQSLPCDVPTTQGAFATSRDDDHQVHSNNQWDSLRQNNSGGGGGGFSWLDFEGGSFPPNPFEMIPAALTGLQSSDPSQHLQALQDLTPLTADELASSGEWPSLKLLLGQHLTSEHVNIAKDAASIHLMLFRSAPPRQAAEICLSVLEALARLTKRTSYVAVNGLALGAHSPAAPVSRLVRLMHCLLSEMAAHFRYVPESTVFDLAFAVMQLLAHSPPHVLDKSGSSPVVNARTLTIAHWLGVYDPTAEWFRAWACRLSPVKMAAALRQSGLTTALIQRAQGRREGQVAEEKEAPAVDASRTTACLDFADATNANPLSSSSDTSLLPWPMLDDFHLKLTLSMLGTIALFHVDDLASSSPTPSPSPPPSLHELIAVLAPHFLENTEVVEREEEKGARNPNKRRLVASVLAEIVDTNSAAADICSREVLEPILKRRSPASLAALMPDLAAILNASSNFSAYSASLLMDLVVWQPWIIGSLGPAFETLGQHGRLNGKLIALSNDTIPLASDLLLPWLWSSRCIQHLSAQHLAACTVLLSQNLLSDLHSNNGSSFQRGSCCWRLLQCSSTHAGMVALPPAVPRALFARLQSEDLHRGESDKDAAILPWRNLLLSLLGLTTYPAYESSSPAERVCADIISECAQLVANDDDDSSYFAHLVLLAACARVSNAAAISQSCPSLVTSLEDTSTPVKPYNECTGARAQLRAILSPTATISPQDSPPLHETSVNWRAVVATNDQWGAAPQVTTKPSFTSSGSTSAQQSFHSFEEFLRLMAALPYWDCSSKKDLTAVAAVLHAASGGDDKGEAFINWVAVAVLSVVVDANATVEVLASLRQSRSGPLLFYGKQRPPPSFAHLIALLEELVECEMPELHSKLAATSRPLASFLPLWWQQFFVSTVPWAQVKKCTAMLLQEGPTALVFFALAVLRHFTPRLSSAASRDGAAWVPLVANDFVLEEHAPFLAKVKDLHGPAIADGIAMEVAQLWRERTHHNSETPASLPETTAAAALEAEAEWL